MNKVEYLVGVQGRLQDDVGNYIELVKSLSIKERKRIGFFALARMLFPIVEELGRVLLGDNQDTILEKIDIPYPRLVWEMYRNSLLHNDHPQSCKYNSTEIVWNLAIIGTGHQFLRNTIILDMEFIYKKLISLLDNELADCKSNDKIKIVIGFELDKHLDTGIKKEIDTISKL